MYTCYVHLLAPCAVRAMFNYQKEKLVTRVFRVRKHGAATAEAVHSFETQLFNLARFVYRARAVGRNIIIASLAHV